MHKKYKYRFKTEEEFIKDFGLYWREEVRYHFPEKMNFLLGKEYMELADEQLNSLPGDSGYLISSDMIIKEKEKPNYKPKKIDRTI